MFNDIGEKIKNLTKIISVLGIVISVIVGIVGIIDEAPGGVLILLFGPLLFWIGGFALYGFGELIDRTVSIDEKLSDIYIYINIEKRNKTPYASKKTANSTANDGNSTVNSNKD